MTIQQIVATKSQLLVVTKTQTQQSLLRLLECALNFPMYIYEGEWHDVFVHSYDEDGSAWFIDAELGNVNKDEDLNLFFEDISYHEMVQCSKAGCSEKYQPIISRCQNCKAKLKSEILLCKKGLGSPCWQMKICF